MQPATRGSLRVIAAQLAVIVGVVHLGLGTYYTVFGPGRAAGDPRVLIWTVAGAVLIVGVAAGAVGWRRRNLYGLGVVVCASLVTAYLLWPVVAGTAFYLGPPPASSSSNPLGYLHAQLIEAGPVSMVAVATELALLALLAVLLAHEREH